MRGVYQYSGVIKAVISVAGRDTVTIKLAEMQKPRSLMKTTRLAWKGLRGTGQAKFRALIPNNARPNPLLAPVLDRT